MKKFDVDVAAGGFEPIEVTLRGQQYVLGADMVTLLEALDLVPEDVKRAKEGEDVPMAKLLGLVNPMMAKLAPEAPSDLSAAEQVALLKVLTELMNSFGSVRFR